MKVTTDGCLFGAWIAGQVRDQTPKAKQLLDIGTGTGLLALMLAQKNQGLQIDGIEIDQSATAQANQNVLASPWLEQVHIFFGDARHFRYPVKYDAIFSNPPFYENELRSPDAKKNIAHHSDDLSLTDLFTLTHRQLNTGGKFYFLFPYKRKAEIENLLRQQGLNIHQLVLIKQSSQHDHFRIMIAGGLEEKVIEIKEIAIRDQKEEYTPDFIELLKDYYLYL